jgi:hypothetical protein
MSRSMLVRSRCVSDQTKEHPSKPTKRKVLSIAVVVALFTAGLPGTASAKHYHPRMMHAPGKHFGHGGVGPWPIFACAGGVITSALVANFRDNRELTADEAWSCGLLFWFSPPRGHA